MKSAMLRAILSSSESHVHARARCGQHTESKSQSLAVNMSDQVLKCIRAAAAAARLIQARGQGVLGSENMPFSTKVVKVFFDQTSESLGNVQRKFHMPESPPNTRKSAAIHASNLKVLKLGELRIVAIWAANFCEVLLQERTVAERNPLQQ
jgi:hypothetical protein